MVLGKIKLENAEIDINLLSTNDKCAWTSTDTDDRNDLVSHCIYNDNCWEAFQTEIMIELFKHEGHKTFVDIGAHVGYYSLIALNYGFDVRAYEKNESTFALLFKNLANSGLRAKAYNEHVTENTPIVADGESVGLIKIDVEGNEPEIVKGLQTLIKQNRIDALVIEISPKFRPLQCWVDLIEILTTNGYRVYDIGLSPRRKLKFETNHLPQLKDYNIEDLKSIDQTNLLFLSPSVNVFA